MGTEESAEAILPGREGPNFRVQGDRPDDSADVERQASSASKGNRALVTDTLMERICEPKKLNQAYKASISGAWRPLPVPISS